MKDETKIDIAIISVLLIMFSFFSAVYIKAAINTDGSFIDKIWNGVDNITNEIFGINAILLFVILLFICLEISYWFIPNDVLFKTSDVYIEKIKSDLLKTLVSKFFSLMSVVLFSVGSMFILIILVFLTMLLYGIYGLICWLISIMTWKIMLGIAAFIVFIIINMLKYKLNWYKEYD